MSAQRFDPEGDPEETCLKAPPCSKAFIDSQCPQVELAWPCFPENSPSDTCYDELCQLADTAICPRRCSSRWYTGKCTVESISFPCRQGLFLSNVFVHNLRKNLATLVGHFKCYWLILSTKNVLSKACYRSICKKGLP